MEFALQKTLDASEVKMIRQKMKMKQIGKLSRPLQKLSRFQMCKKAHTILFCTALA